MDSVSRLLICSPRPDCISNFAMLYQQNKAHDFGQAHHVDSSAFSFSFLHYNSVYPARLHSLTRYISPWGCLCMRMFCNPSRGALVFFYVGGGVYDDELGVIREPLGTGVASALIVIRDIPLSASCTST